MLKRLSALCLLMQIHVETYKRVVQVSGLSIRPRIDKADMRLRQQ